MTWLCSDTYKVFFSPGEVTEIRALGCKGNNKAWEGWTKDVVSGYFDNAEAFGLAAYALEKTKPKGVYFVLNPIKPELLARCSNRLRAGGDSNPSTGDPDILCLRWLYIDIDPIRPSGISATDAEHVGALALRDKVHEWLKEKGIPAIRADSGNGAHLLVRLPDLPNVAENKKMIERALAAIHAKWKNDTVEIDKTVFNQSRICKLYGTWARKGDSTKERPHRQSFMESSI